WYAFKSYQETVEGLTQKFNETKGKELGIHVTPQYQDDYDDLHQKYQAACIAGTAPDILDYENSSTRLFAESDLLLCLDKFVKKDKDIDIEDFIPGLMENAYANDKLYALPYMRSTPILYINEDILNQTSVKPENITDWNTLKNALYEVKDKTGKYGMTFQVNDWYLEAFMLEEGSSMLNKEETKTNVNSQAMKDILKDLIELKNNGIIKVNGAAEADKQTTDVLNGAACMWFHSTGALIPYQQAVNSVGMTMKVVPLPKRKVYAVPTGGCNIAISSKVSKNHQEAAYQFIKWMTETEQCAVSSKGTGYLPARTSTIKSSSMLEYYKEHPNYTAGVKELEYSSGRPMNPGYPEACKALTDAVEAILISGEPVETTLKTAEIKINSLLNE
ncbi:MAG: ABC transporter substrate-binding protein, partial [Spirochaetales bacterium]|nr:ABC transporter substrate-binding protein [Spirochaetales bacterium]